MVFAKESAYNLDQSILPYLKTYTKKQRALVGPLGCLSVVDKF
jgi:hypothetical protein